MMHNSPSQQHETPQLTVIDGEGRSSSTKYYPADHPFSVADRHTPYKKIFSQHPIRSAGSISHRRTPRRRGPKQSPAATSFQSPPTSSRAAWNSTNNDLSIYSLTEEEQQRRKKVLRTPVDTGRRKPHRMKSVAPSPGGATGPKKYATPTTSMAPAKMKRAWCPSGKTSGKGLVERTPGFVDDSWMKYAKNKQEDGHGIDEETDVDGNGAHDVNRSNNGGIDRAEAVDATDTTEYNDIDRGADPFRTSSVSAAQRKQQKHAVKKKPSAAAAAVSSFRKPVGTKMSLHTASKAWAKRKESHSDVFTAQDAKLMSALRGVETTPSEQPTATGTMPTPQAPTTPTTPTTLMTPMTPMVTMTPRNVKRSMVVPPRPIKASTELGRRQRAEQETAFMELEAQLSRLRVVKGIVVPQIPASESTLQASPGGGGNAPKERDVVTKHWIGFHTNVPSTTALFNNTPNPTYNTRTMLTSLAHVASTLASSLAENEIRLQEESKARIHMQDLLLDTQSELKHLRAQQSEDSDAIARMITQMPDVALNYLTTSPSASPVVSPAVSPSLPADVLRGETSLASVTPLLAGSTPPSEYSSLLLNHATTMKEDDLTIEKIEEERFAMTSQDVVAVASLPEMGTANDEEGEEDEQEELPKPTVVHAGYNPRTTTQMGFTITEFVSDHQKTDNNEDEEMARQNIPSPAPRTSVPTPTISSGPGYRNVVLDSPLEAPLGKINYNSYMKRPSTNEQQTQRTNVSPVRQKTNAAAAWLRRRK